ncbi:hypothetical protein [Thermoflavimicrobium dichotomicum]|uniref:Uncharacterized protein n=1 Tax=Thermoflavimicrobium dichotomicum TaxID=46223 RepID=A0A1I3QX02_9BACL|nr:hypothetical protein [Thermoflavimicrobium dichotomicum]SFJ38009.1 hypothetical protein SAMN05421852_108125 [Thermoflavimicrobium dichotomicum]
MVPREIHHQITSKSEKEKALTLTYIYTYLDNIVSDPFSDPKEAQFAKKILTLIADYKPLGSDR